MMNNDNKISIETKLYGFIGEHAGASRFSAIMNKKFKSSNDNIMMIPMNIREDDLYFTLSNMKQSHVNGAIISSEYVNDTLDVLDESSQMVKRSGMCDIVFKEDNRLRGDIFGIRALTEQLKDMDVSRIALIGVSPQTKAFSFLACGFECSFFSDNLEELMNFTKEVELKDADLNRIADGMDIDLSSFDAVLDFSNFNSLSMISKLAKNNFDMKNAKQISTLKQRANELGVNYSGYDDMLDKLCDIAYLNIKKS